MIKLNLGCGHSELDGYVGIDKSPVNDRVIGADLEHDRLPFDDGSVEEVLAEHFLEHLWDVRHCLNECWRVLKPGGKLEVRVPYGLWEGAQKPHHHQCITESWFDFLRRETIWEREGYRSWDILLMERINDGHEIHCVLTPRKPV